ncbi:MAG TPA: NAD(P)/FAD-dependent oxidoreductase [Caulobacteraceae bacterium]
MTEFDIDAVVVGAGCVGLACAYALARDGASVFVLEQNERIGEGVSSRNSEVVHGGLYYPTGSLKARLCVEGRRKLYGFLDGHGVAYDRCGKLVVATDAGDVARLDAIFDHAVANEVEGMVRLSKAEIAALEPELRAEAALLSPQSGVLDSHGYMLALQGEIENRGGAVALNTPFEGASPLPGGGFEVRAGGAEPTTLKARRLVLCPGLGAQAAAAKVEGFPARDIPELHYGKGSYFVLAGPAPFKRLIYPPPIPGSVGLHYRRDLGGQAHFGPDLEFVEVEDYRVDPARAASFYAHVRTFWPALPDGALSPDYAGIRPKLHGPGEAQPDFQIEGVEDHGLEGLVALFGIESPGLTASLAIGDEVARRLAEAG